MTGRRAAAILALLWAFVLGGVPVRAHDIPNDVTLLGYLKPEGPRLRLLVRVPLVAMRDMTWPLRAPDVLDLSRAAPELTNAATLWVGDEATLYEGATALPAPRVAAIRATAPGDRAFETYEQALAFVTGPPPAPDETISVREGFLDVLFEYPIQSDRSRFSIDPRWGRLGIRELTRLTLVRPGGAARGFELRGDPGLVRLDPSPGQVVSQFVVLGAQSFVNSMDALLFLACLIVPLHRPRDVVVLLTAFLGASSFTLIASSVGAMPDPLWFPVLVGTLTAGSALYASIENIASPALSRRWQATSLFGLAYGFGFALALRPDLQLAGAHVLTSVLAFNVGMGVGVMATLGLAAPLVGLLFRYAMPERAGTFVLSGLIAHTAWHATADRARLLWQYQLIPSDPTPAFFAGVLGWLMAAVAVAGVLWLISALSKPGHAKSSY